MSYLKLEDIGFYTLSDERARTASVTSPLHRCEMILTDRCNFKCPYCRGLQHNVTDGNNNFAMSREQAIVVLNLWIGQGLKNVRFSGGEPMMYPHLRELASLATRGGVGRIAISTNGSFPINKYEALLREGVNDISVSLDGCCATVGDKMTGTFGSWERVVSHIRILSEMTYVTVGMVFTEDNVNDCKSAVEFAASLGVADIRVIPSAQYNKALQKLSMLPESILAKLPILRYRVNNIRRNRVVRGINSGNHNKCRLVLDDMAVAGDKHFPCIIYMREGGAAIGRVGPEMRAEREEWMNTHEPWNDKICKQMCLDVCVDHNRVASSNRIT